MGSSTGLPQRDTTIVFVEDLTPKEAMALGASLPAGTFALHAFHIMIGPFTPACNLLRRSTYDRLIRTPHSLQASVTWATRAT